MLNQLKEFAKLIEFYLLVWLQMLSFQQELNKISDGQKHSDLKQKQITNINKSSIKAHVNANVNTPLKANLKTSLKTNTIIQVFLYFLWK